EQLETLEPVEEQLETLEPAEEPAQLEAVEGAPPKKERLPREPDPADVIAELLATYRGGHPKLEEGVEGTLYLEKEGLWFTPEEGRPFRIPFGDIDNVMEPAKGEYPDAAKSKARNAKLAGGAAKLVGNLAGNWLGGWGGKALKSAGQTAGDAAAGMD